jgi:hypothetical protein
VNGNHRQQQQGHRRRTGRIDLHAESAQDEPSRENVGAPDEKASTDEQASEADDLPDPQLDIPCSTSASVAH